MTTPYMDEAERCLAGRAASAGGRLLAADTPQADQAPDAGHGRRDRLPGDPPGLRRPESAARASREVQLFGDRLNAVVRPARRRDPASSRPPWPAAGIPVRRSERRLSPSLENVFISVTGIGQRTSIGEASRSRRPS
ncbi:MAG: hypothetical protein MZV64_22905 [Ignavibacteriales bacterium]|nr:hypothetical protein [Ignavibacteriales bacterium]